ncbi:MAG: glycosyltransferase [Fimbriimonadales bacterium]|nr:glycosyltransferase [Fimbriimonadales bacterium]
MPSVVFHVINGLGVGGAERVVVHLLQYHDRSRYQPVCICLNSPTGSHYEDIVRKLDMPLYFLERRSHFDWRAYRRLDALFRQYRPTIVHTHLLGLNYAYLLMLRHRTRVRVHTFHSLAQQEVQMGKRATRLYRNLAFRYRIGGVVPVAISKEVARTIEQLYGYQNAPVILNGVEFAGNNLNPQQRMHIRAEGGAGGESIVVAHVGRFVAVKNHALLLRAFARLRSELPLYLWLVGDGELRAAMEQLAQELGIAARVRFWGIRADAPAIINAADIFAFSSTHEGFGLAVAEAMAAGLPVVATAVGGVPELVEHGVSGLLVPNEDEDALVQALQRLVDDPALRQAMGARARAHAQERFDARAMTRAYEALYESILAGR